MRILTSQTAADFDFATNSNYDIYEFTGASTIFLPAPSSFPGRTIYIRKQFSGTLSFAQHKE